VADKLRSRMGTNAIGDIMFEDLWVRIAKNGTVKEPGKWIYSFKYAFINWIKDHYEIHWYNDEDGTPETISNFRSVEQCIGAVKDNYRRASSEEKEEVIAKFAHSLLEGQDE
jgi:hypothetical protein